MVLFGDVAVGCLQISDRVEHATFEPPLGEGGIYGNDGIEAMYPLTRVDATGEALDGSKHNYTLTFPKGGMPPVNAFWSVTMYDGKTQLLIENPINRYLCGANCRQAAIGVWKRPRQCCCQA
jgi:hypothetical protein